MYSENQEQAAQQKCVKIEQEQSAYKVEKKESLVDENTSIKNNSSILHQHNRENGLQASRESARPLPSQTQGFKCVNFSFENKDLEPLLEKGKLENCFLGSDLIMLS